MAKLLLSCLEVVICCGPGALLLRAPRRPSGRFRCSLYRLYSRVVTELRYKYEQVPFSAKIPHFFYKTPARARRGKEYPYIDKGKTAAEW